MFKASKTAIKLLILTLSFVLGQVTLRAQRVNDSITVALLTCSPGDLVYELYGHTAIRVTNHTRGTDAVFNYGVFEFSKPHFVWRFVLGKTDYLVQPLPFTLFEDEYVQRGSSIVSQTINLTRSEANEVERRLIENAMPENRVYRYNFLTCNCTTRVRDMVESCIEGDVLYKEQPKKTYREMLHEYTREASWSELGNDLLLGANTDTLLSDRAAQFLPFSLQTYFDEAVVLDSANNSRPLVLGKPVVLLEKRDVPRPKGFPLSPLACGIIFAVVLVLLAGLEYWLKKTLWVIDLLLMPGVGVAGLLVTFMAIFSEHPTVGSNWQVWVFNPIPLVCMPWVVWSAIKQRRCVYHYANVAVLILFIVAIPWIPQHFSVITLPLALGLLTRPLSYIINYAKFAPATSSRPGNKTNARKFKRVKTSSRRYK